MFIKNVCVLVHVLSTKVASALEGLTYWSHLWLVFCCYCRGPLVATMTLAMVVLIILGRCRRQPPRPSVHWLDFISSPLCWRRGRLGWVALAKLTWQWLLVIEQQYHKIYVQASPRQPVECWAVILSKRFRYWSVYVVLANRTWMEHASYCLSVGGGGGGGGGLFSLRGARLNNKVDQQHWFGKNEERWQFSAEKYQHFWTNSKC